MTIGVGVLPILGVLNIIRMPVTPGTPVWVGVAAGLLFVLAGVAVIDAYARLKPRSTTGDTLQTLLAVAVYGVFGAIFAWIAFGPGTRRFGGTMSLPFITRSGAGSEWTGRGAFAIGAVMAGAMAVATVVRGFHRRRQAGGV